MPDPALPHPATLVVHDLTLQVEEAQDTLCAIRKGEVDALVVVSGEQQQIFVLQGADHAHRVIFDALNEGALTIAADATILRANRKFAELVGRPLGDVLGARLGRFVAGCGAPLVAALLEQVGGGGGKGELVLQRADGERVPVMASVSPLDDGEGGACAVVITDLTSLVAAQGALHAANEALEARVVARTEELSQANEALRAEVAERRVLEEEIRLQAAALVDADLRKDEFLSMLAHELRNPLAPIRTATELLRHAAGDLPRVERYRGVIERQVGNLARLVEDLLDVSRITRRAITLREQEVELAGLVTAALEAARPLIDARDHALFVTLPAEPVHLFGDPTRLEQILVNLLNNAAKYTERGGKIGVSAEVSGAEVAIRVRDSGVGMAPELLPRIFDLFVQADRSLDRAQGGLGIGLTLVKRLVELHGGTVEAHSDGPGRGSEIVLRLPLAVGRTASDAGAESEVPAGS